MRLREIAVKAKLKLNEYGLFRGKKMIAGATESDVYKKLRLDYVEPILREDRGEVEAAVKHTLPDLVRLEDIKGDFHIHTVASDGACEIPELVEAARRRGYKFICITDHSVSEAIANGLSPARLSKQIEKIRKVNEQLKDITIFAGAEVDILADGSLDYDNKLLAELDFVIGSIHSGMIEFPRKGNDPHAQGDGQSIPSLHRASDRPADWRARADGYRYCRRNQTRR